MLYVKMESILFFSLLKNPLFTGVNPRKPPHQFWTNLFQRLGGGKWGLTGAPFGTRGEQKFAPPNHWKGGLPPCII